MSFGRYKVGFLLINGRKFFDRLGTKFSVKLNFILYWPKCCSENFVVLELMKKLGSLVVSENMLSPERYSLLKCVI